MRNLFVITMICLTPSIALAAEAHKAPVYVDDPGVYPKSPPAKPQQYPPVMGKELDALRTKLEDAQKQHEKEIKGQPAPLGYNSPKLAPGQKEVEAIVPAPPTPIDNGPPVGSTLATAGQPPKGWTDCAQTHASKQCDELTKTSGLPKGAKWIIKLPENGSVDDLNKFLDQAAASRKP